MKKTLTPSAVSEKSATQGFELLEHISDGVLILDRDWRFIFVNRLAEEFLNTTRDSLLGQNAIKLFKTPRTSVFYLAAKKTLALKTETKVEDYHPQLDRWFSVRNVPYKEGLITFFHDVTDLKNYEKVLLDAKEQWSLAQQVGGVGTFEWDFKSNKVYWSPEEEKLFGLTPGSFNGTYKDVFDKIYPEDIPLVKKQLNLAVKRRKDFYSEFRILYPDHSIHWLATRGHFTYNKSGEAIRMVGVNYDISEKKNFEEWLDYKSEVSRILSASLDFQATLRTMAHLTVPRFADWLSVDLVTEAGGLEQVILAHKDPKMVKLANQFRKKFPVELRRKYGLAQVIRTGKKVFIPMVTDEMVMASAASLEEKSFLLNIGFRSVVIMPLMIGRKVKGAMTFISTKESNYQYSKKDLLFIEQIASRAALAIENSILYKSVQKERERLDTLVANVPGVVWEAYGKPDRSSQRINFVSSYVETLLGYTQKEWLGTPNFWLKIVHPEDKKRAAAESAKIFASKKGGVSRFRWMTKSGEYVWVEAHSHVVLDEKGRPIGMRGVTMDVSEGMALVQRKDEFISLASHELKTPIASLKIYLQLLQKKVENGRKENLESFIKMDKQISKLTVLVNDLLDISRMQNGKLTYRMSYFDLNQLVEEVTTIISYSVTSHKLEVVSQIKKKVYGDRDRLGQVLNNLIINAIKYSSGKNKVLIRLWEEKEKILVSVQDFGIGIPKEFQAKIFDRFYRVPAHSPDVHTGLGIGLYISKEIVDHHNGEIWVASDKGQGTIFTFSLPIRGKSKNAKN